ncbi:MAG: DNA methyltransferase [Deltaproteobacteria bacterium]|nr:DNA methyltransferase [Deltaproteobacteria bacterium]
MRGMNSESVDLVYLDPPFNSNRHYAAPIGSAAAGAAFKDTWTLDDVDEAWHGEIADRDPTLYAIIDAAGYAHGKGMKSYLIMMAVRLMEMRRILKETGSIYLHCDPTASHYLKTLMDALFGADKFRSDISWKRSSAHSDTKQGRQQHGRIHDVLLFYTKGDGWTWNPEYTSYDQDYIDRFYRHVESNTGRRYRLGDLTGPGGAAKGNPRYEVMGVTRYWRYSQEKMQELIDAGRVVQVGPGRVPAYKRYLDEMPGVPLQDLWTDIRPIGARAAERIGYPTQKPLALLERVIRSSSNERDVILDPFCGCATACVAAEKLGRQWVGIDLSAKAADLVKLRLRKEMGLFYDVHHRLDIPRRLDQGKVPDYRTHKHTLYGVQEGLCAGCRVMFPFRNMTVDHVVPQAKGGTGHIENLQLLCAACNSMKGTRSQEEFVAVLVREGLRQQRART